MKKILVTFILIASCTSPQANGGSENFKEELIPETFNEIEKEMKKYKKYNDVLISFYKKESIS